jgi:hypothetical protein
MISLRKDIQNIMVRYGTSSSEEMWGIEISHFDAVVSDDRTRLQRRVVMRTLPLKNGIGSSDLGNVSYWIEEKDL